MPSSGVSQNQQIVNKKTVAIVGGVSLAAIVSWFFYDYWSTKRSNKKLKEQEQDMQQRRGGRVDFRLVSYLIFKLLGLNGKF